MTGPTRVVNPWLIAVTVTLATFMELLDTSIANVSLPYIGGGLGRSYDEVTWILTTYLVANAVVLPMSAWLSRVFGRKNYYMGCVILFTLTSLIALAALVGLVLLIACANVANLMSAQAAARAREMALRVSIGAGRGRLVQLVLVESAMLAFAAAALGGLFAWCSAPFVVSRINPPDNPARLSLPADWRVFAFGLALTLCVTLLFGLARAHSKAQTRIPGGASCTC